MHLKPDCQLNKLFVLENISESAKPLGLNLRPDMYEGLNPGQNDLLG
jgi:hypothetical protein